MSAHTNIVVENGTHFSVGHLGSFAELHQYVFSAAALGDRKVPGKVFLKENLGLTGVEMSWNAFPVGAGMPFLHTHRENEEVYLFISGEGEFMVDGRVFPIREGSVVRVAPDGARAYRNTGDGPLHFIVLQVKQGSMTASTIEDGVPLSQPLSWPESVAA